MRTEFGTGQFLEWLEFRLFWVISLGIQWKYLLNGFSELNACHGDINGVKCDSYL